MSRLPKPATAGRPGPVATLVALLGLVAGVAPGPGEAAPVRHVEQVRQEQRFLPASGYRQVIVDGWGAVTVIGTATPRIVVTATLHGWGATPDEAQQMLKRLRWYLDPAGRDAVRIGADGPRSLDAVSYRGQRYGRSARLDLKVEVPSGTEVRVATADGPVTVRDLAAVEVTAGAGAVLASGITGPLTVETISGSIGVTRLRGKTLLLTDLGRIAVNGLASSLVAKTKTGAIDVRQVGGNADLHARNGRIVATGIAGALSATSTIGAMTVTDARGGCDLRTTYGRIAGLRLGGPVVSIHTESGSIRLDQRGIVGPQYDLRTTQGRIEVSVPRQASLAVSLSSPLGQVESYLPLVGGATGSGRPSGHVLTGVWNGGLKPFKARSDSGAILLKAAP